MTPTPDPRDCPLLGEISKADAEQMRAFFADAGYTEDTLRKQIFVNELPSSRLRNLPRLLDSTREPNRINTLIRWFWLGLAQEFEPVREFVPEREAQLLLAAGLLTQKGVQLIPEAMLVPWDKFLIASDHTANMDSQYSELVLWPNPTSRLMSRCTVRRHSRATLDIGTGNGILAFGASRHSDRILATDLNPRALQFARFNARLNGIENVEFVSGDGFQPAEGQRFDLIVSNPPFFISPKDRYLFCDNPMELDGLCRLLVKQAPAHLNEGAYFQMLCEWAQVRGETWQERLSEWLQGTGCDAWVFRGTTQDPSQYAQERIRDIPASAGRDSEVFSEYMSYYRTHGVEVIHGGLITMRLRSGKNWILMEENSLTPKEPFGDYVEALFAARDLLHDSRDALLAARLRLAPEVELEHVMEHADSRWRAKSLTLRMGRGLPYWVHVQPLVAEFLGRCDGTRPLAQVIDDFVIQAEAPAEQVRQECLDVVTRLLEHAFLRCRTGPEP
jgi:methylase of polypeptide subunit release factors